MTKQATWYFDYISPYPYLQMARFDQLPADLEITAKPVLFAGLLGHWDQKGPAEIPAKRRQTYRYCHWLANKRGIPFKTPPRHPFNPLALLRLTIALGSKFDVIAKIYHHIWGTGHDGQEPESLKILGESLGIESLEKMNDLISEPSVKLELRQNTEEAIQKGVFGVPTFVVDEELYWGDDALDMMTDYLANPEAFSRGEMQRLKDLPIGVQRKESRL